MRHTQLHFLASIPSNARTIILVHSCGHDPKIKTGTWNGLGSADHICMPYLAYSGFQGQECFMLQCEAFVNIWQ